ncbi:MAG: Gx transporter family protein [Magnetococcales bacterium]|nr:Gx transporter family protein [Magnetococcales bacterium]
MADASPPPVPFLRRELLTAHLAAAAIAAHVVESLLPGVGPWFKPGLANIFSLVACFHVGLEAAVAVTLIRVVVGSLAVGSFLTPGFFLALSGAIGALGVMALTRRFPALGPAGVSVLAALAHMTGQVLAAWGLFVGHGGLLHALPWFLAGSWATGLINGVLTFLLLERLEKYQA